MYIAYTENVFLLLIMSMFRIASLEIFKKYSQSCSIVLKSWKMGGEGTSQMKKILYILLSFQLYPYLKLRL